MPNRCGNSLHVTTKKETDLSKYFILNGNKVSISMNKVVPIFKKDYKTLIDTKDDWYDQCCSKRGTKREVQGSAEIKDNKDGTVSFRIYFDSARSPPIEYYEELYKQMLQEDEDVYIHAEYGEGGVGFIGEWINGRNDERNYDNIYWIEDMEIYIIIDQSDYDLYVSMYGTDLVYYRDEGLRDDHNKEDQSPETLKEIERILSL